MNMKKIIKFSQNKYNWICELEVGEFPSFLKKGKCDDCSKISLDKKEKNQPNWSKKIIVLNNPLTAF